MCKPTQEQIAEEITKLEQAKTYAPHYTAFGDDNHAKIDAQIAYLKGDIEIDGPKWDDLSVAEQDASSKPKSGKKAMPKKASQKAGIFLKIANDHKEEKGQGSS